MPEYFKHPDEISKDLSDYISKEDCYAYVAETDGIIGFLVGYKAELKSPISKSLMMGSIDEIYIKESKRNMGVGSGLVERFSADLRKEKSDRSLC